MNKMTLYMDGKEVGEVRGIEARLCLEIAQRQKKGLEKYGKALDQNDAMPIDRLQHLKEELLDGALYAEWAIKRMEGTWEDLK